MVRHLRSFGRYEFASAQPCPLDVQSAELTIDASALPVGAHGLRLTLEDAAGNTTVLSPARTFEVQAPRVVGRVAGPIPHGGVLVRLEARDGRRWVPVATTRRSVRTSPAGRYRLSYRFRSTFEPITYRFRVVVDEDSEFRYRRGSSAPLAVRVSP